MIQGVVYGDRETVASLREMTPKLHAAVVQHVERLAILISNDVKENRLSGQALKVRTGRLRRSINYRIEQQPSSVFGIVGTNVEYAARHEFGFHGTEQVREYLRRRRGQIKADMAAHGKKMGKLRGHRDSHDQSELIRVRAHQRKVNYAGHPFLRPALKDAADEIRAGFREALRESVNLRGQK